MTMYEYVAMSNPRGAKSLIESFGYRVTNPRTMGANLRMLVAQEGEEALKGIAEMHPDRELIMEVYGNSNKGKESFFGVDALIQGQQQKNDQISKDSSDTTKLAYQTNAMMIVVALVIASAIIVNQKK